MPTRETPRRIVVVLAAATLVVAGCSAGNPAADSASPVVAGGGIERFGPAPTAPDGALDDTVVEDLDLLVGSVTSSVDVDAIARLGASGDIRVAWLLTDLLRFVRPGGNVSDAAMGAWEELTGRSAVDDDPWGSTTNHLIAWDTPAPPGYAEWKRRLFEPIEPGWAPFFADVEADIDWRLVSWGGVLIDDRPIDQTDVGCPQGCIPALNDPALTDAESGSWYPDSRVVFGIVVDGEAVALPKNIMEVHEMVNMTIAGRRIGIPYCTLCGSAQAYFTDDPATGAELGGFDSYELRTSGLLTRSNKVMYEFHTMSAFDTFTGKAVSGPLRELGVELEQVTVRASTWGDWKATHPDSRIIAEDGGIGRSYSLDPLGGRDDDGPIFPIGDTDPRLAVQEPVIGVVVDDTPLAFPVSAVASALAAGATVSLGGVTISTDGAGFLATGSDGEPIAAHQAFWFAWSQFHPDTALWDGV
jgi:hypothetical protein